MKLASIQKITALNSIEGADNIEVADILGWKVVVKKGMFKVGDLVCYCQIDCIAPELPYFEFLRERKFRIKTIKLRKQVSQGLIVGLDDLECFKTNASTLVGEMGSMTTYYYEEGDDVTELVGITKYSKDKEIVAYEVSKKPKIWWKKWIWLFKQKVLVRLFPSLKKVNRSRFPSDIVNKTDEERIQNMPRVLEQCKGKEFNVREKLDGSSITIICNQKGKYRVCSRNFELHNKQNEWYKVFESTQFNLVMDKLYTHYGGEKAVVVQWEFIGTPQGNPYKLEKNEIRVFNIYVGEKRLNPIDFLVVCTELDIPVCPDLGNTTLNHSLEDLLKMAEGKSALNSNTEREGIVMRSLDGSQSFKVVSNKFLLKNGE